MASGKGSAHTADSHLALIVILFALSLSVLLDVMDWQKANEGVVVVRTVEARKGRRLRLPRRLPNALFAKAQNLR